MGLSARTNIANFLQDFPARFVYHNRDGPIRSPTMDIEQFRKNIEYAKNTGLDAFYLWGAEWWYWMKTTQNRPEIWSEAQKLFAD